jgi:hypothetical protein
VTRSYDWQLAYNRDTEICTTNFLPGAPIKSKCVHIANEHYDFDWWLSEGVGVARVAYTGEWENSENGCPFIACPGRHFETENPLEITKAAEPAVPIRLTPIWPGLF